MGIHGGRIFFLLIMSISIYSGAAVTEKLNVQGLSRKSDVIAIGRIVQVQMVVENGRAWSIVTLTPEKQMKGERLSTVEFRLPGGQQKIGNRTLVTQVEGVPLPGINERAIVFLGGQDRRKLSLTGLGRGYWRVGILDGKEVATATGTPDSTPVQLDQMILEIERTVREKAQQ